MDIYSYMHCLRSKSHTCLDFFSCKATHTFVPIHPYRKGSYPVCQGSPYFHTRSPIPERILPDLHLFMPRPIHSYRKGPYDHRVRPIEGLCNSVDHMATHRTIWSKEPHSPDKVWCKNFRIIYPSPTSLPLHQEGELCWVGGEDASVLEEIGRSGARDNTPRKTLSQIPG